MTAKNFLRKMIDIVDDNGRLILVDSIRDYSARADRFSYTPYFFVNEISNLTKAECRFVYCADAIINVNQIWFLTIDLSESQIIFGLETI